MNTVYKKQAEIKKKQQQKVFKITIDQCKVLFSLAFGKVRDSFIFGCDAVHVQKEAICFSTFMKFIKKKMNAVNRKVVYNGRVSAKRRKITTQTVTIPLFSSLF